MEQVFGVPRATLEEAVGPFQGFRPVDEDLGEWARRLEPLGSFRPRDAVEDDPTWQQIIPYVALTCRGRVLTLERLATQGEARLHHKVSIGVGGHVNPEAPGPDPLLVRGLLREVSEEVALDADEVPDAAELLGFINDDSNEVGAVHFGLAVRWELSDEVDIRESDRMVGHWRESSSLEGLADRMETWSRFLAPALVARLERDRSLPID